MQAVILKQFGSVDNFELTALPVPSIKKGEIRIKIKAVSFNPVDYQIRRGLQESRFLRSNILGRDLSGIVDEVDEEVKDFRVMRSFVTSAILEAAALTPNMFRCLQQL